MLVKGPFLLHCNVTLCLLSTNNHIKHCSFQAWENKMYCNPQCMRRFIFRWCVWIFLYKFCNLQCLNFSLYKIIKSYLPWFPLTLWHQEQNVPGSCCSNIWWALQNCLTKIHITGNHIYGEYLKLKLCTCAQSHALGTRTTFHLRILIRTTISAINNFKVISWRAHRMLVKQPPGERGHYYWCSCPSPWYWYDIVCMINSSLTHWSWVMHIWISKQGHHWFT